MAAAVVLGAILIGQWIAGWGLVTIHVKDVPLRDVISSIERQGHLHLESSVDPLRPTTMDVDHVTPVEAIDLLAVRADASWRSVVIAGPSKHSLDEAMTTLRGGVNPEGWTVSYYPSFSQGMSGDIVIDPRQLEWKAEGPELDLAKLLDEAAQKSGVMTMIPRGWTPVVPRLPKAATAGKALQNLIASVRGQETSLYCLVEQRSQSVPPDSSGDEGSSGWSGRRGGGMPAGGDRQRIKPEWVEQRALARIKKLPPDMQADAQKMHDEIKSMFAGFQGLSDQERRDKMSALMANPAVQEQMDNNRLMRDSKMSAEQRINRSVRYLNRKASAQASGH